MTTSPTPDQTGPLPEGPEYTPCACSHIEPEHEPNAGECYSCDCAAYRPVPAVSLPPADQTAEAEALWDELHRRDTETDQPRAADQAALRDRIAAALYDHSHPGWAISFPDLDQDQRDTYLARADAVLAVLPATTDQTADRAALLRAEADRIDTTRAGFPIAVQNGITWATAELRRHAAECPECGTTGACNGGPCPLRRMADETPAAETGCWCGHPEDRHWTGAPNMTIPNGCHDCQGWDGAHVYGQPLPWLPETGPGAGARQDGAQQPGLRERHRAAWNALTPDEQAARLAELDQDDERQDGAQPT